MVDVFLSHSEENSETVVQIAAGLEAAGLRTWYYERDSVPGPSYLLQTKNAIENSRVVLVFLSPDSLNSTQILREIIRGYEEGKVLLPVLYGITHRELVKRSPEWHEAFGSATAITMTPEAAADVIPRLLAGLEALGIAPPRVGTGRGEPATAVGRNGESEPGPTGEAYDVFIGYRRDDGASTARLIRSELRQRRFRVFLDVDDLRPGLFDDALLEHIEKCPNFILVLTPGSLDRCGDSDDWLRREIGQAIETGRNIVPIMMPGFQFPKEDALPQEIRAIRRHQCLVYSNEFFDAMINKLVGYLK
jgi:hypothetical protein